MHVFSLNWQCEKRFDKDPKTYFGDVDPTSIELILGFCSAKNLQDKYLVSDLKTLCPNARLVLACAYAQIHNEGINDAFASLTFLKFDHARFRIFQTDINKREESFVVGQELAKVLNENNDLKAAYVFGSSAFISGAQFSKGLTTALSSVPIVGGLCGTIATEDKALTMTPLNWAIIDDAFVSNTVIGIGFYGETITARSSVDHGWEPFSSWRTVTKASGKIIYELDHKPILDIYRQYLDEEDYANLPLSALILPLKVVDISGEALLRGVEDVDFKAKSMVFTENVDEGARVQVMQGQVDALANAAFRAAFQSRLAQKENILTLAVSCLGRKVTLGTRIEDEVFAMNEALGKNKNLIGFYSHGEICQTSGASDVRLHNHSICVMSLGEVEGAL